MIRFLRVSIPTIVVVLFWVDLLIVAGSYLGVTAVLLAPEYDLRSFLFDEPLWLAYVLVIGITLLIFYFLDLYTDLRIPNKISFAQSLCLTFGIVFCSQAVLAYMRRGLILPRWVMIDGSMVALVALFGWRILFSSKVVSAVPLRRIVFMGATPVTLEVAEHLSNHPEMGFVPIGFLTDSGQELPSGSEFKVLGGLEQVAEVARKVQPDRIVVGLSERRNRLPVQHLLDLRFEGVRVEEIADLYELTFGRVCTREMRPSQLIFTESMGPQQHSVRLQLLCARIIALVGLIAALPVMLVVALLVRLSSPGPVLLRQSRVGLHNMPFIVLKFRSMYQDAEARTGAVWATRNDPRITPIGWWLRKLRLDELPQLINVLRGDMAIVGPRPERTEFVKALSEKIPYYPQRHSVLPGITGWAQINYKYGDTIEDTIMKLEYDLYYIKHISMALDFYVMFHTAKTMLMFRGAQ